MKGKTRRCSHCKKKIPIEQIVTGPSRLKAFCSVEHLVAYAKSESGQSFIQKVKRKAHKEDKEKLKTKQNWLDEAQKAVNAWVRFRDRDKVCVSCGVPPKLKYGGYIDAGHYRSVKASSQTRFNTWNIHAQCVHCNRELSGNHVEYRHELIRRIGIEKVEAIESDQRVIRYSVEYLKRLKAVFQKRLRIEKKIAEKC